MKRMDLDDRTRSAVSRAIASGYLEKMIGEAHAVTNKAAENAWSMLASNGVDPTEANRMARVVYENKIATEAKKIGRSEFERVRKSLRR